MEQQGLSTVVLTPMPEFHNAVGIPRSAAIEYPFGRLFGEVNDRKGQREVLEQTLSLFEKTTNPGHVEHLSFSWHEEPKHAKWHPPGISPIVKDHLDEIKKMKI
jgi:hypothetical protein